MFKNIKYFSAGDVTFWQATRSRVIVVVLTYNLRLTLTYNLAQYSELDSGFTYQNLYFKCRYLVLNRQHLVKKVTLRQTSPRTIRTTYLTMHHLLTAVHDTISAAPLTVQIDMLGPACPSGFFNI